MTDGRSRTSAPALAVEVSVEAGGWAALDVEPLARAAAAAALAESGARVRAGAEIAILFADDAAVRALNRDWRSIDKATNVLSFPAATPDALARAPHLGDIALAFETCAKEARDEGKTLADHAAHLVVHGVLHLVGHDHESPAEAEAMEAAERRALARLGVADPYADTVPQEMTP